MSRRNTPRSGPKHAVIYTRVSTEIQGEGYSLPTQLAGCRDYAEQHGYLVDKEFEDLHTGTEIDRPGLNALLDFVRSAPVDAVIVYHIDRFSRNVANQAILEMELAQRGTLVEYVLGGYDDTPEGEMMKMITGAIAQYENRQRAERSVRGRKGKARAGYVVLTDLRTPYGYDLVTEPHKAWLVVNEVEAPVVRQMFAWARAGMPTYSIARELSMFGILTRGDQRAGIPKQADRGMWSPSTVRSMLTNSVYKGEWVYFKTRQVKRNGRKTQQARPPDEHIPVPVPAIVDAATWEAVQQQLQRNKQYSRRNAKRDYLLRGLVRCQCGRVWQGVYKSYLQRAYYRCPSGEERQWLQACTVEGGVRQERLEEAIWQAVEEKLLDADLLRTELAQQRAAVAEKRAAYTQRLKAIAAAAADTHRKLGILLDQVLVAGFTSEVIEDRKRILVGQLQDLQAEEARTQAMLDATTLDGRQEQTVLDFAETVRSGLHDLEPATKRQVLELLQVQVEVVSQTEFRVTALIPIADRVEIPLNKGGGRRPKNVPVDNGSVVSTSSPETRRET